MKKDEGLKNIADIFRSKARSTKKPPAYEWQDLALRVVAELKIPNFKRSSVFKACKENPKPFIEKCLNDTKELCQTGVKWQYFFKLINKTEEDAIERGGEKINPRPYN